MKSVLSPIRILVLYLTVLMLIGSLSQVGLSLWGWIVQIRNFVLIFGSGYGLYRILLILNFCKPTRWEHRFITSSILFLLFYPDFPWYVFLGLGMVAEALQRLLRFPIGPMMNPAALTALVAALLGFYPAWWGASFSPRIPVIQDGISIAVFLTIPIAGYVAYTYRKLPSISAFLISFTVTYLLIVQQSPLFLLAEGTVAFFALVMLVEPKTSPVLRNEQLIYGATVGLFVSIASKIFFSEPYAGPLILCNLLFNLYRNRRFLSQKFVQLPTTTPASPPVASDVTINP